MKNGSIESGRSALKIKNGYIVFNSIVASLLVAFIIFKLFDPDFYNQQLRWIWLNSFFQWPQYYRLYISISAACLVLGLAAFLSRFFRRILNHPIIFALFFSIPFFIIRFSKFCGDMGDWIDWISGRYFMSEPGATLIHNLFYKLLHYPFNLGGKSVIALTSALAGFCALAVIALISNTLFADSRKRMFFRLVFFFSGPTLLFFGYIENTPLLIPVELLYIYFMIKYLSSDATRHLVYAALILSVASIIHGSVCFVLPSIFIALLAKYGFRWRKLLKYGGLVLVLYFLAIALFAGWAYYIDPKGIIGPRYGNIMGGGDKKMFVPLFKPSGFGVYTLFSRTHYRDMFNIIFSGTACNMLIAPLFLVLNFLWIRRGINPILFGYFAARFTFLFLWNCDWGFFADWDLMIPNALPVLLISAYAVSRGIRGIGSSLAAVPVLLASILVTVMFFFTFNEGPPSLVSFPAMQPIYYDEGPCVKEGLVTKYYIEKSLTTPVGETATDFPYHLWGRNGPIDDISGPPFGVIWDGFIKVRQKGRHRFEFVIEDNYRLYLNNQLIAERWTGGGRQRILEEFKLYPGLYKFRLEYYNNEDYGSVLCCWEEPSFDKRKLRMSDFCYSESDETDSAGVEPDRIYITEEPDDQSGERGKKRAGNSTTVPVGKSTGLTVPPGITGTELRGDDNVGEKAKID